MTTTSKRSSLTKFFGLLSLIFASCAMQEKGPRLDPFAAINPMQRFDPLAPPSPLASAVIEQWGRDFAKPGFLDSNEGHWHTRQGRDELVYRLILMADYRFQRYEADLVAGKATRDTFIDLAVLGMTSAAALLTPGQATQVLAAISGGLIGSRATIEKNFYQNQAQPVLLRKMQVLRSQKLFAINHRLRRYDTDAYPTERALIDVLDYYNRGTMLSALQEISNDTAAQEIEMQGGKVQRPALKTAEMSLPPVSLPKGAGVEIQDLPNSRVLGHTGGDSHDLPEPLPQSGNAATPSPANGKKRKSSVIGDLPGGKDKKKEDSTKPAQKTTSEDLPAPKNGSNSNAAPATESPTTGGAAAGESRKGGRPIEDLPSAHTNGSNSGGKPAATPTPDHDLPAPR